MRLRRPRGGGSGGAGGSCLCRIWSAWRRRRKGHESGLPRPQRVPFLQGGRRVNELWDEAIDVAMRCQQYSDDGKLGRCED